MDQNSHVLDNLCWHSLNNHHSSFALGNALAKRYPADMWDEAAIPDHSEAAFHDLEQIAGAGEIIALFEADPPLAIPGWSIHQVMKIDQLVCQQRAPEFESAVEIVDLTAPDLPAISQLIDLTLPGTYYPRTFEMGRQVGVCRDGKLIAMAGERIQALNYCEISAVCTHPDWRGRGYARLLCSFLANKIWDRGDIPILHVFPDNMTAYRLYESLHFTKRCQMTAVFISHP